LKKDKSSFLHNSHTVNSSGSLPEFVFNTESLKLKKEISNTNIHKDKNLKNSEGLNNQEKINILPINSFVSNIPDDNSTKLNKINNDPKANYYTNNHNEILNKNEEKNLVVEPVKMETINQQNNEIETSKINMKIY